MNGVKKTSYVSSSINWFTLQHTNTWTCVYTCIYMSIWIHMWECGEGYGNPLQCSCLENPIDGGGWGATVHGVTNSQTRMNNTHTHTHTHTESEHCSVVCNSLRLHGLQPARLLCPWNSPGKNTGVGCHSDIPKSLWWLQQKLTQQCQPSNWTACIRQVRSLIYSYGDYFFSSFLSSDKRDPGTLQQWPPFPVCVCRWLTGSSSVRSYKCEDKIKSQHWTWAVVSKTEMTSVPVGTVEYMLHKHLSLAVSSDKK